MSGIFGFITHDREHLTTILPRMGQAMCHRPWYQSETIVTPQTNVGIGRVGIGIFNAEPQPVCDENEEIYLSLSGEFYQTQTLREELVTKGYVLRDHSVAELALRMYQAYGPQFVEQVEGIFAIAIVDQRHQQLFLLNDRFGLKPIYYAHYNHQFIFAPELKAITLIPSFPRQLNQTALAEYIRFQQLLGDKTFFEDISLQDAATILRYDWGNKQLHIEKYWQWQQIQPLSTSLTFDQVVDETIHRISNAVNGRLENTAQPGIYLTGGLDSRIILAVVKPEYQPITTITYGHYACRDVQLARQLAKAAGTDHHFFDFRNGNWVKEVADFHLELTEGAHSWVHAHGMSILPQARQLIQVNLSGVAGGLITRGAFEKPHIIDSADDEALLIGLYRLYTQEHSWPGLTEPEAALLYTPPYQKTLNLLALDSLRTELAKFKHSNKSLMSLFFNLSNHSRRFNYNFVLFHSSHFENRCPFFDYRFVEWMAGLPAKYRVGDTLQKAILSRTAPNFALVPYDKNLRLATNNRLLSLGHSVITRIQRNIHNLFSPWPYMPTLYADYENYLRYELKDWAEDILFDERTLSRNIFRREALRSLMDRHLSGHEEWTIGKISHLITFEMMMRRLFDE